MGSRAVLCGPTLFNAASVGLAFPYLQRLAETGQCEPAIFRTKIIAPNNRQTMCPALPQFEITKDTEKDIVIGVATHDMSVVAGNLALSPVISSGKLQLFIEENSPSASIAYNRIIDRSDAPFIVLAHHDVYLPRGWDILLRARIAEVTAHDPDWAVIAPFGVGHDLVGYGTVWSSSIGTIVGRVAHGPVPVQTADELLLVLRRDSGLRFDETLPGFHLYGTDIVQSARSQGGGAYAMTLPLIHNDGFKSYLDDSFAIAYRHQSRKWRDRLPLYSPTTKISWHMLSLLRSRMMNTRSEKLRQSMAAPVTEDPRKYAALCGWGDLTPPEAETKAHQPAPRG